MALQKQILNSKLIIILLLFAFFPPAYLGRIAVINLALDALKLAGFIMIFALFMVDIKKHLKKPFNILLIVLLAELLLSTLISKYASLYYYISTVVPILGICFLTGEIALHNPYTGLKSMYIYFSACVLINTATIFLFPNAMYANNRGIWVCWFLGEDNSGYIYYIVASTVAMIYTQCISKKATVLSFLVRGASFVFTFYRDIGTGKACQIIWAVLVLGYQFEWIRRFLKARYVLYVIAGGFVALVLLRSSIIAPIASALGRNVTITGRTLLWDRALIRIKEKPLLGFGLCTGEKYNELMNTMVLSAHNWLLMLMFYGGIVAVVLFSLTVICACRDAKPARSSLFYRCMVIGLIVLAVRFLVEAGAMHIMFMMLAMIAYSNEFTQGLKNVQVKKLSFKNGNRLLRRK